VKEKKIKGDEGCIPAVRPMLYALIVANINTLNKRNWYCSMNHDLVGNDL
jgi:hypothetical protein